MAVLTPIQIKQMYESAVRQYGDSEGLRAMACMMLDEVVSEQTKFSASAERRATEAEAFQEEIAKG